MVDADMLKIMCCPETHQGLHFAEPSLVANLNSQIEQKALKNRAGHLIAEKLETGLIRADGKVLYPIRQNIPVMLLEEAIPLSYAAKV